MSDGSWPFLLALGVAACGGANAASTRDRPPRAVVERIEEGEERDARAVTDRVAAGVKECEPASGGVLRVRVERARGAPRFVVTSDAAAGREASRCLAAVLNAPTQKSADATEEPKGVAVVVRVEW